MELDYKAIGKRIKIARIQAELSQEALAEKADLSPTHMSNIENANTKLSLPMLISIANALFRICGYSALRFCYPFQGNFRTGNPKRRGGL